MSELKDRLTILANGVSFEGNFYSHETMERALHKYERDAKENKNDSAERIQRAKYRCDNCQREIGIITSEGYEFGPTWRCECGALNSRMTTEVMEQVTNEPDPRAFHITVEPFMAGRYLVTENFETRHFETPCEAIKLASELIGAGDQVAIRRTEAERWRVIYETKGERTTSAFDEESEAIEYARSKVKEKECPI